MSVTISLPNRIENRLKTKWGENLPQVAIEALAIEGYRRGVLSLGEVAEMLDLSINEADGLLKSRNIYFLTNLAEIDADSNTLEELLER